MRLFDIPESKHYEYSCKEDDLPSGIDFSESIGIAAEDLKAKVLTIGWLGEVFRIFQDGPELYAINEEYLKPFAGGLSYIKYHRRQMQTTGGGFILGINVGLGLQAIICPSRLHINEAFAEEFEEVAHALKYMGRTFPKKEYEPQPPAEKLQQTLVLVE